MVVSRAREIARFGARRATAWARLRPTFLVIGAQRSGSTSLEEYLSRHPAILTAVVKEVQYFHRCYAKGDYWYRSRFPLSIRRELVRRRVGVSPAIGEASPDYLFDPRVPARVHAFNPHMKLIAVLRDPVDRAFSQWRMITRHGHESRSFEEALDREESDFRGEWERLLATPGFDWAPYRLSLVARGMYAEQLESWLELFPWEQLLVLVSEEMFADPVGTMARVAEFLGIPSWHAGSYRRRGAQGELAMNPETRERLARTFVEPNRRLQELLGRELPWALPALGAQPVMPEPVSRQPVTR